MSGRQSAVVEFAQERARREVARSRRVVLAQIESTRLMQRHLLDAQRDILAYVQIAMDRFSAVEKELARIESQARAELKEVQ